MRAIGYSDWVVSSYSSGNYSDQGGTLDGEPGRVSFESVLVVATVVAGSATLPIDGSASETNIVARAS